MNQERDSRANLVVDLRARSTNTLQTIKEPRTKRSMMLLKLWLLTLTHKTLARTNKTL
jgi:hypothetical protein